MQVEADNQEQQDIADLEKRELRLTKEVKELEQGRRMSSETQSDALLMCACVNVS